MYFEVILRTRFCWLSNFCDHGIIKNKKNEHLWSSNSQKDVIFLQEVSFIDIFKINKLQVNKNEHTDNTT